MALSVDFRAASLNNSSFSQIVLSEQVTALQFRELMTKDLGMAVVQVVLGGADGSTEISSSIDSSPEAGASTDSRGVRSSSGVEVTGAGTTGAGVGASLLPYGSESASDDETIVCWDVTGSTRAG